MANVTKTYNGVVHGNAIELEGDPNLPDGQQVTVTVQPMAAAPLAPGEGLRRSAGGWNDDPAGLDAYLNWNRQQRKHGRPEIEK
jgi:hypothetical protein